MAYQETLTDVPADRVEMIRSRFQAEGATVEVVQQADGNFTVVATFQNAPWAGRFAPANAPQAAPPRTMKSPLETRHPGFDELIAADAKIERVAGGLGFTEGPVWRGGALLFSDIPNKRIVRWRRLPEGPELTTFATGMS